MTENWAFLLSRPEHNFPAEALAPAVRGRRVLVTGAGGSIGGALARRIRSFGPAELALLDAHEASLWRLRQALESESSSSSGAAPHRYVLADVRDRLKLRDTLSRFHCDVVFHLAAYKHVALAEENVDQAVAVNLIGTLNLIEAATQAGVAVVVLPTTDKTVNPTSLYGCSKRVVERVARAAAEWSPGPNLRAARLVNVLGSQGSVVEVFARQIAAGESPGVTDPLADRYYLTMDEAVGFLLAVAAESTPGYLFGVDVGSPIRTAELARRLQQRLRPGDEERPMRITGLKPGERLHEELTYPFETRRRTAVSGIFALEAPPETSGPDEWLGVLQRLRRELYEWETAPLRAYLFELARAERPARAHPGLVESER